MVKLYDLRREVERTMPGLDVDLDGSGNYARIADEQNAWWQPAEPLYSILRAMPDHSPADDEQGEAEAYAEWCKATAPAGFFGHNAAEDTMPTPPDFRE